MSAAQIYDRFATDYRSRRRPDPRIARAILAALGGARTIVNVGAGTGSYEPSERAVVAAEPSAQMILQRPETAASVVQAAAHALPFADRRFDASLALPTVHHWGDRSEGLAELARVARQRVVIFTWDPATPANFWLVRDYFPTIAAIDREVFPALSELREVFGPIAVHPVLIPHDCSDGFLGAYWRRPDAYLDESVRRAISTFSKIGDVTPGLDALRRDLSDGTWTRRNEALLDRGELDLGYRLVIAQPNGAAFGKAST